MSADRLQPPDLVFILKAIPLISYVPYCSRSCPKSENTLAGASNIRKHQANQILFPDSTRQSLPFHPSCRLIDDQRIRAQHARFGDRLGSSHRNMCLLTPLAARFLFPLPHSASLYSASDSPAVRWSHERARNDRFSAAAL